MDAAQLAQVEELCNALYNAADDASRNNAQQQLLSLQQNAEYIPQCQYILDHSESPYARLLAANSLTRLITTHWNNFTVAQRVDIRNYILSYLANNGPNLDKHVVTSLIQLLCRITKLGWFDDPQHRELVEEVKRFLQATIDHCIIGLRILCQLVEEVNIPTTGRTLPQHRKTAVSFRDLSLFPIFNIALNIMQQLQSRAIAGATPDQEMRMGEYALTLFTRCLGFDFIGTNPDEASEDVGTIQVPTAWKDVISEPSTMGLLFEFYKTTEPPRSQLAMQGVVLMSSVRRSLFAKEQGRAEYLQRLMDFLREVLQTQTGLHHQENYHEFCRQLGRLKANYQLTELVKVEGYLEWVEAAATFTVTSLEQWRWSTNSIHYLLALWGRLVTAVPYVRPDTGAKNHTQRLQDCVIRVVEAYIVNMVNSVEVVMDFAGAVDDPLEDEGSLKEQLDRLPVICRFEYSHVAQFILNILEPKLNEYNNALQLLAQQSSTPEMLRQFNILEKQLTWLVYMVGAIVGGYSWQDASAGDGVETIDAGLSRRVFQLAQHVDYRLSSTQGQGKADEKLELALLYFFQTFKRMYIWEQHGLASQATLMVFSTAPKSDYDHNPKQKAFARFFEHMGMGEHSAVINTIITKIGNNLKYWPQQEEVVGRTLTLFFDMASGYSSSKMLLGLDTVKYLIANHTPEYFPFLSVPANTRHRTTFHMTLARLIFISSMDDLQAMFLTFMEPLGVVLTQLQSAASFREDNVKQAVIGVCRDLRGVTAATNNKRVYSALFEFLYPAHFPVFVRAAEECADMPDVTTALLKFLMEFVFNKAQRLVFEQSSPNGILLFRETSKIICAYGSRLLLAQTVNDVYKDKYKGISLVLGVLMTALSGTYVNFGVFALYNDPALDNALQIALKLALSVELSEVMAFPKLCKAYYSFFEILFRCHVQVVLTLDTAVFMQIMQSMHEGLQALDAPLASQCAATIDHLATYLVNNATKDVPPVLALKHHLVNNPTLLPSLMGSLFNILLYDTHSNNAANQWAVTRPILSLLLADESSLNQYKDHLISSQPPEHQARLTEAFTKLLGDVHRNLESTNRDAFTTRLTIFRTSARQFLTATG